MALDHKAVRLGLVHCERCGAKLAIMEQYGYGLIACTDRECRNREYDRLKIAGEAREAGRL